MLRRLKLAPRELLELNSLLAVAELVRGNVGFTIAPLPKHFNWDEDPALRILPLPGRAIARRVGLLEKGQRSHITGVVRDELLAHLGRRLAPTAPPARSRRSARRPARRSSPA